MGTWIRIYALLSRKHTSRDSCVFGVKFWTQIFVCVKKLTLSNSASMQVLYNCSWFTNWITIWRFILDLRTFVVKSALSRLRALGGSFWQNLVGGGTKTFYRTGSEALVAMAFYKGLSFFATLPKTRVCAALRNGPHTNFTHFTHSSLSSPLPGCQNSYKGSLL